MSYYTGLERGRDVVTIVGEERVQQVGGGAWKKHSGNKDLSNAWKVFYRVAASHAE